MPLSLPRRAFDDYAAFLPLLCLRDARYLIAMIILCDLFHCFAATPLSMLRFASRHAYASDTPCCCRAFRH